MRFFGSHSPQAAEEEPEPEEDTKVARLFAVLDDKLKKNREHMEEVCEKAERLTSEYPKLRAVPKEPDT